MKPSKASNFRNIFGWSDGETEVKGITIPIIQRDYAQGRKDKSTIRIRDRFLGALYDALVENKHATLDFIYGNVENGRLIPLDGQQRLTTLFLLHYYIARHEDIADVEWSFLQGFSYETRVSSRKFCQHLLSFIPDFQNSSLSNQIENEAWFLFEWKNDPTVNSMLVMLDAIHNKFKQTTRLWPQLIGGAITFYFLPLKDLNASDKLYIKMNSRGKPLTRFENFKAELELKMKEVDEQLPQEENLAGTIISKIDGEWNDMLWPFRNSETGEPDDEITDDEYLRYIRFISDIICYRNGETEIADEFDIIEKLFSLQSPYAHENMKELYMMFDIWCKDKNDEILDIEAFFNQYISVGKHEEGKIMFEDKLMPNLFRECCRCYGKRDGRRSLFSLAQTLLLYAFTLFLNHRDKIDDIHFRRRLRIVHNLIKNSSDAIRTEYMRELLLQVDEIIMEGKLNCDVEGSAHFQKDQLKEEAQKLLWTESHPTESETLFRLEDHKYLNGYVKAVAGEKLEHVDWCERFYTLFDCDLREVIRALLATGDFFEKDGDWRYQVGTANPKLSNKVWRGMFSPSRLKDNICRILQDLLSKHEKFSNEILKDIADYYLMNEKEMPVRYYLVKYEQMHLSRWSKQYFYGKFYWRQHWKYTEAEMFKNVYHVLMMTTEKSMAGMNYDIFLKAIFDELEKEKVEGVSLGDYSYREYKNDGKEDKDKDKLHLANQGLYLTLSDNVFHLCREEDNIIVASSDIRHNENGIDIEDRVEVGLQLLAKYGLQIENIK